MGFMQNCENLNKEQIPILKSTIFTYKFYVLFVNFIDKNKNLEIYPRTFFFNGDLVPLTRFLP